MLHRLLSIQGHPSTRLPVCSEQMLQNTGTSSSRADVRVQRAEPGQQPHHQREPGQRAPDREGLPFQGRCPGDETWFLSLTCICIGVDPNAWLAAPMCRFVAGGAPVGDKSRQPHLLKKLLRTASTPAAGHRFFAHHFHVWRRPLLVSGVLSVATSFQVIAQRHLAQ